MAYNQLAASSSAYLRSASHQPIDWHEFGEAAFHRARELDCLILLDIGAVWCHWCHVIDRESYENPEIADLINAHYVAVKVDRDQRPDIDARYQQVVASMTGQGGWPLTAFLTPDGRVLYGGTYFPPEAMKKILLQLKDIYHEQKSAIMADSLDQTSIASITAAQEAAETAEMQNLIPEDVFERILSNAQDAYDPEYGGFGLYPKFPHFSALEFLIQQVVRHRDGILTNMVENTLTHMAQGGIYDHIGGGFHRYSVDREWHVPHFEKMAYDNAEALKIYAQAYRLQKKPLYREVVEGILRFTRDVLSDPEQGGFYASQDADIDLEDDGDYFTWTMDEVKAILTPEEAELVIAYYDLTPDGDMHGRPGRNVLRATQPLETWAQRFGGSVEELQTRLQSARQKLLAHRNTRPTPFIDRTLYLNWNGMVLASYFEAADLLEKPDIRAYAQKILDRLLKTHVDSQTGQLLHTQGVPGMLEDYAWLIQALIKAYQSTTEVHYLGDAQHWMQIAQDLFEDKATGGFYDIPAPNEDTLALLRFRRKPSEDTPSSSANAVMARNLIALYWLTGAEPYIHSAERLFQVFGQAFAQRGLFSAALAISLYEFRNPPAKLEVVGTDTELQHAAQAVFYPGRIVRYSVGTPSEIRICEGTRCMLPVTQPHALQEALKSLTHQPSRMA